MTTTNQSQTRKPTPSGDTSDAGRSTSGSSDSPARPRVPVREVWFLEAVPSPEPATRPTYLASGDEIDLHVLLFCGELFVEATGHGQVRLYPMTAVLCVVPEKTDG